MTPPDNEQTRQGLKAAIRAANLALFVIRKQGIMPNSSWEAGFTRDIKTAEDALAALKLKMRLGASPWHYLD